MESIIKDYVVYIDMYGPGVIGVSHLIRHLDVMKSGGLDDTEIAKLKSLPQGFSKGMVL